MSTLRNIKKLKGPQLLHVITKKGKGYDRAEADPVKYHGVSPFDPDKGILPSGKPAQVTYTSVFSDWVCDMAELDDRLVAITPAMREGSGLVRFEKEFPKRYFDVGIAEQHAVNVAAGMACEGIKPVVAIYSTFLQRGYDQLLHDVALQNLPVLFAIDRAGFVGADGPTHHGVYDYSFMRCLPNMVIMAPADENECRQMLYTGMQLDQPSSVRYPRGGGPGVEVQKGMTAIPVGKAEVRRETQNKRLAILAFGSMVATAEEVGNELDAMVVNMRFVKPIDTDLVMRIANEYEYIVTIEENVVEGGAGSAVSEVISAAGLSARLLHLGIPDRLIEHGTQADNLEDSGLNRKQILRSIENYLNTNKASSISHIARA